MEIVQLVGKDSLAETDKITLEAAKIIREDYLAQNAYSPYDPCCPFFKSVWMANNIVLWYNLAVKAVELSTGDRKINLAIIKQQMGKTIYKLSAQKFEDPKNGREALEKVCIPPSSSLSLYTRSRAHTHTLTHAHTHTGLCRAEGGHHPAVPQSRGLVACLQRCLRGQALLHLEPLHLEHGMAHCTWRRLVHITVHSVIVLPSSVYWGLAAPLIRCSCFSSAYG